MAAGTVNISPHLLPWRQAGVDFLLAQDDLPPEFSLCHEAQPTQGKAPVRGGAVRLQVQPVARADYANQVERTPYAQSVPQPVQVGQAAPMGQAARQAARRNAQRTEAASPLPGTHPAPPASPVAAPVPSLPPEHWPRPWRERLKVTRPAPVVWTYWALGEDLCGTPHAERRDLLRRLLGDLGHPAGTHTFWPSALPAASAVGPVEISMLEAQPHVFWSGVDMLKARAVVVMGSPAVKALELPPRLRPFQQTRHNGRLVVVLRDVDFLAQESQHYDAVREFLRQALAPFGR